MKGESNTLTFSMKVSPALYNLLKNMGAQRGVTPSAFARSILEKELGFSASGGTNPAVTRPAMENRRRSLRDGWA